jgi:hypothetical protein
MVIETKHHVNKTVWLCHNKNTETKIWYRLEQRGVYYIESDVFDSKEELLKSL